MKALKPEDQLSADLKTALDRLHSRGILRAVYFHVPNEFYAFKNRMAAWAIKKTIGCVAGAPDWVIIWRGGVLLVELKAKKTIKAALGALNDDQRNFAMTCEKYGIVYEVHISVEGVLRSLQRLSAFGESLADNLPEFS